MEEKEKTQAENGKGKGSSKRLVIIVILCVVFLLAAGGAAYYFLYLPLLDQAQGEQEEVLAPEFEYMFDSFVVNLAEQDHRRYLKVTMIATYHEERLEEELESRVSEIRNEIIDILRSKTLEDVQKENSTKEIRKQVGQKINSIIREGRIEEVYFTDFIIQ